MVLPRLASAYGNGVYQHMADALMRLERPGDDPSGRREGAHGAWLHAHPDINSFSIFARGQWLAVDPGYSRVKDTRDHNTVIVNGKGQAGEGGQWLDYWAFQQRQPAPAIRLAESTSTHDTVLGDAGAIYVDEARLRQFRWQVLFLKPDVFVIADDIEAQGP
jgi:hypothetical protein